MAWGERVTWASEASRARTHDAPPRVDGPRQASRPAGGGEGSWAWRNRRWLPAVAAGAGAWAVASTAFGTSSPLPALAAVVAGVPVAWLHVRGGRTRGHIEVIDGSVWPWHWEAWRWRLDARRDLRTPVAMWPTIAKAAGIPRARLRKVVADPEAGVAWHVELDRGDVGTAVKIPAFTSAVRLPATWVVATPDARRPWLVVIEELPDAPANELDEHQPWSPPAAVDLEAERLEMLHAAVGRLADQPFSVRALAREAGVPRSWVADRWDALVRDLGLEQESGRMWRRAGVSAGERP